MADEELIAAAAAAARSARRAVSLALVAVAVAAVVLAIDHGIKRAIISEADRARKILDDFKLTVMEAMDGGPTAGPLSADSSPDRVGGDDLVHAPRPPAGADQDAAAVRGAARHSQSGVDRGPDRDE